MYIHSDSAIDIIYILYSGSCSIIISQLLIKCIENQTFIMTPTNDKLQLCNIILNYFQKYQEGFKYYFTICPQA